MVSVHSNRVNSMNFPRKYFFFQKAISRIMKVICKNNIIKKRNCQGLIVVFDE